MSKKINISKQEFKKLYEKEKLTTFQISDKLNCCQATIWKKLKEFNVKPRLPGTKRVNISKEKLHELYINKKLSTWKIEKQLKIPRSTIYRKLNEFNIKIRDISDSHIIYSKNDFSGNKIEKAYLIGFRIGDLGVRKRGPKSKVICVASGSTIKEQIDLIENLFKNYGNVWIKKTNNKINTQVFLNDSFEFLLSKETPTQLIKNKKTFFSFLAGFTDAEGHIGIYNNMAKFSIGNYDDKILFLIYNKLNKYGIKCNKPRSDQRKGKENSQGYKYNQNYWQFGVYKKENLEKLFKELKPYILHKNKVKALNKAISNINYRSKKSQQKKHFM